MAQELETIRAIARALGYSSPTSLQEAAFGMEGVFGDRDMMVIGDTSCGKTLVPMLLYYKAALEAHETGGVRPRMVFTVPYRALASQKYREFSDELDALSRAFGLEPFSVALSTGEYRSDDDAIREGRIDVAIVITEKVFRWCAVDMSFMSRCEFLVIDELGLVRDSSRGIKMDFLLVWACERRRLGMPAPRVVALGTPSYDWSRYAQCYGLLAVEEGRRPVRLIEATVECSRGGVCSFGAAKGIVESSHLAKPHRLEGFLKHGNLCPRTKDPCSYGTPARWDSSLTCEAVGASCVDRCNVLPQGCRSSNDFALVELCAYHVRRGDQVLVFKNDREQVRSLCARLYLALAEKGLLEYKKDPDACRREVLDGCGLEADDLGDIMEVPLMGPVGFRGASDVGSDVGPDTDGDDGDCGEWDDGRRDDDNVERAEEGLLYEAFSAGVAFHSAAMPIELRSYVEERLLERRDLKVVCCTETLAYGVNSTVDVVIIADLGKMTSGGQRLLTENEYRNYAGRAGRLRKGSNERVGYVYTLLAKKKEAGRQDAVSQADYYANVLHAAKSERPLLSSGLFCEEDTAAFYVLNLMGDEGATRLSLEETVGHLPTPLEWSKGMLSALVSEGIDFLASHGLAEVAGEEPDPRGGVRAAASRSITTRYRLTQLGNRMRGYIVSSGDYLLLRDAVRDMLGRGGGSIDADALLYRLVGSQHVSLASSSMMNGVNREGVEPRLREFFERRAAKFGTEPGPWIDAVGKGGREGAASVMLAALLAWSTGASAGMLYREFGVHYPLLQHVGRQVGYLLEIACELLEAEYLSTSAATAKMCERVGITFDPEQVLGPLRSQMRDLFVAVNYGIDTSVLNQFKAYLIWDASDEAHELLDVICRGLDPGLARLLRRMCRRYRYFADRSEGADGVSGCTDGVIRRADGAGGDDCDYDGAQFKRDIHAMGPLYRGFFKACFPEVFAEG